MWLCMDWWYSFRKWACIWLYDELKWEIRGREGKKGYCVEYNQYILFEKWNLIWKMTFKGDNVREM